jgi:hypothetical protein
MQIQETLLVCAARSSPQELVKFVSIVTADQTLATPQRYLVRHATEAAPALLHCFIKAEPPCNPTLFPEHAARW